ncbi:MAG: hypothetical protein R3F61_07550 [Myxococcota bacterium]
MIDVKPMLRATAALSGLGLIAATVAGFGSAALVAAVVLTMANLVGLSVLAGLYTRAVQRGESAAAGLAALHGKTLVLLGALAFLGISAGFEPVALGFALVTTCFTVAVPVVASMPTSQPAVEAL